MDVLKSFSREEFECHIDKLQKSMAEDDLDLLILSSSGSIFYGSGYRSWYLSSLFRPVFVLVPREGEPAIVLRYLEKSTVQNCSWISRIYCAGTASRNYGTLDCTGHVDGVMKFVKELPFVVNRVGYEGGHGLSFQWPLEVLDELRAAMQDVEFVDGSLAIMRARMRKTPWEIDRIRTAGYITERAIVDSFRDIRPGYTTEKDLAAGIASRMCAAGIDQISYLTVNSGTKKLSTFNSYATSRVIEPKDLVLVDISGHIDGYASDLTRTFYAGHTLPEEYREMADLAKGCLEKGISAMKPGMSVGELNQVIEDYLLASKYAPYVVHSSGHSIGLNVVEYPNLEAGGKEIIQPGMVFALENGIYPYDKSKGAESIYLSFRLEDQALMGEEHGEWLSGPGRAIYTLADFT